MTVVPPWPAAAPQDGHNELCRRLQGADQDDETPVGPLTQPLKEIVMPGPFCSQPDRSASCGSCPCSAPPAAAPAARLVLATQVAHTAKALRSLALRNGRPLRQLAPGLLSLDGGDLDAFVSAARGALSSVEADEVRCLLLDDDPADAAMLGLAMTAPSLATAGARREHADLVPLFVDEARRFSSVYQPIVSLSDGRTVGHEALLRASLPDGEPVYPDVLFPAAEAAGWTHLLDRIGRTTALRGASSWLGDDLLFINFIPTSIYRPQVCLRTTERAAADAGIRLDQLVFEVTESHQVRDLDHLEQVFGYYRSHNCKVALDDLGAGYSSLNMLVRLRPDIVKLDKELVQALPDPVSEAVIAAIVSITHSYGGLVLAECVETQEQAAAATALGVDLGQGWLFGRPVQKANEALAYVESTGAVDPAQPDPAVLLVAQRGVTGPAVLSEPDRLPALLTAAVHASTSGVVVVDAGPGDYPMLYVNPAFEAITGYSAAESVGRNCRFLQGPDTDAAAVRALAAAIGRGEEHRVVLRNYRKDGTPWWNELHLSPVRDAGGRLTHYLGFQHDVTGRVAAEERLLHQASHDSLTGLANRTQLFERLDAAVEEARRAGTATAVLFLDLDGFKGVNDGFGHVAADQVLVEVAVRARAALRSGDLLARTGGDEFVAVLGGLDPLDAGRVADRAAADLTAALARPFAVGSGVARLSGSVGVALYPEHAATSEALLARADAAMYLVKATGRGSIAQQAGPSEVAAPS
jgi:diguanylate cyclase (GGDEF)-like protein/PAS domain S-box-containing protein